MLQDARTHHIGPCRYQPSSQQLLDPRSDETWRLPRAEQQVLDHLLRARGEAVEKQVLRQDDDEMPSISESAVVKAVFTLRHFIGDEEHRVIETVKGVGYRLARGPAPQFVEELAPEPKPAASSRRPSPSKAGLVVALLVLIGTLGFRLQAPTIAVPEAPVRAHKHSFSDTDKLGVHIIAANVNTAELLERNRKVLHQGMLRCKTSYWDRLYLALSHDGMVLNLTATKDFEQRVELKNIKISDFRVETQFITPEWIEEVGLCER